MSHQKSKPPLKEWLKIIIPAVALIILILILRQTFPDSFAPNDAEQNPEQIAAIDTTSAILQANDLFSDYARNKVAFDKKNNDKQIEFQGTIKEISNEWGCASIKIEVEQDRFYEIECSNCPEGVDKWAGEVAKVKVGDLVAIKGYYSASISGKYSMDFYKCRIAN